MWLKLCLLLIYITVLFVLARFLEAVTWFETGSLSRRLLDPMALSVAKLKALLEQRGISYDTVVEKSELTQLVEGSGPVHEDELELQETSEDNSDGADTNFTSGPHFYEQVEDAKDSVWLVQVIAGHHSNNIIPSPVSDSTWKAIRKKVTKFGVHTGVLDCRLDPRWCDRRGWQSSHLLLALPQMYRQKANVATYTYPGPLRQHAITHWIRQKLHEKVETILDFQRFKDEWLNFKKLWQDPEIRTVFFTRQDSVPMFFSALSVKFPGRVRFGVLEESKWSPEQIRDFKKALNMGKESDPPQFLILTKEGTYVYGRNYGECYSFSSMETFLKFLHPCLNDIFVVSFLIANVVSVFELFVVQGTIARRLRHFLWCLIKYNAAVIMLWLPLIALFQLPYLSDIPLLGLKSVRLLATSSLGAAFRRDIFYWTQHPYLLVTSFMSACTVFGVIARWWTGGRYEEDSEPWNFAQMRTLTHLRPNEFFEPMLMSGYEFSGGMEIFGSRLSVPTMSLQPVVSQHYIGLLPTWQYRQAHTTSTKTTEAFMGSPQNADSAQAQNLEDMPEGAEPEPTEFDSTSCLCCASANDLLDGNYKCECQGHTREQDSDQPPPHSCQAGHSGVFLHHGSNSSSNTTSCASCHGKVDPVSHRAPSTQQSGRCCGAQWETHSGQSPCQCPVSSANCSSPASNKASNAPENHNKNSTSDPRSSSEFPEGYLPCTHCVICLDEFAPGSRLCGLPCGHVFHHSCILSWLNRDHHFCPVCRWPSFRPRQSSVQSSHLHDE